MDYSYADIESFVSRFWLDPQTGLPAKCYITPYAYSTTFAALAQNGVQTQQIQIQANADFICLDVSVRANIAAAQNESTMTAAFVRLLITDTGSNEQWTNTAQDVENYCSNGQRNTPLPYPRIVQGRSSLQLQATNYAPVAETYSFDVMLEGVHVRRY
jgi:hypothetical protein